MKLLFLTHRLPYAPNRGDRIRAYHMLQALSRSCEVHLFSLADRDELSHIDAVRHCVASVSTATPARVTPYVKALASLGGSRPLTHVLLDAREAVPRLHDLATRVSPDIVLAYCSGMARFAVERPLDRIPCVIDMVDVDSAKWEALGTTGSPLSLVYRREAKVLSRFEAKAARHAALTMVVNERERDTLRRLAPSARIEVVENGVDRAHFAPDVAPGIAPGVVFCGVMDYAPNVEGVRWFVREVWPHILAQVPSASFTIVGSRPTREVLALTRHAGIRVTGSVPDVRPNLWDAAVSVAPLLIARGLQNKVLEALAAGLPVVSTPAVAQGLPGVALRGCTVAAAPEDFAAAVIDLLRLTPAERRRRAASADLTDLSWQGRMAPLMSLLNRAVQESHRAPHGP